MSQSVQIMEVQAHPTVLPDKGKRKALPLILINPDGTRAGTVKTAAAQADTTAVDLAALKVDFNALLAKLRTAGVIASS